MVWKNTARWLLDLKQCGQVQVSNKRCDAPPTLSEHSFTVELIIINPFASIGRTGTSKAKVKVRDICLNISFLT